MRVLDQHRGAQYDPLKCESDQKMAETGSARNRPASHRKGDRIAFMWNNQTSQVQINVMSTGRLTNKQRTMRNSKVDQNDSASLLNSSLDKQLKLSKNRPSTSIGSHATFMIVNQARPKSLLAKQTIGSPSHRHKFLDQNGHVKSLAGAGGPKMKEKKLNSYRIAQPHNAKSHRVIQLAVSQAKLGVPIEEKLRRITINANLNLTKKRPK